MSEAFAKLSKEQQADYRDRVTRLGLDPDSETSGHPIMIPVKGVAKMRELVASGASETQNNNIENSPLTAEKVPELTDMMARQAVVHDVLGKKRLKDASVEQALDQRFPNMPLMAYVAPDITITAANPLIINSTSSVTVYGTVTIKDGGYIIISVDANFYCESMVKIQGGNSPATHDITIQGNDAVNAVDRASGGDGKTGNAGSNAKCDCCGGSVAHSATNGGPGGPGDDGQTGFAADRGLNGPTANVTIQSLSGNVTLLNRGGNGGKGGNGGNGGKGGTGGKGGNGTTCGAFHPSGKQGGKGGDGGNGGASANGGDGGNGGRATVIFTPTNSSDSLIASNVAGNGGDKGNSGQAGSAGIGGAAGSRGGSQGPNGTQGSGGADNGRNGVNGNTGSLTVNGQPI